MESEDRPIRNKFILTKVYGNSMFPTLRSRDKVIVRKVSPADLNPRDIIIFEKDTQRVCHRIIKIDSKKGIFYTRGDFILGGREEVRKENIIGKAIALISREKIHSLKWQSTFFYCLGANLIVFLKELATFPIDNLYNFYLLRKFLKRLGFSYVNCFVAKTKEDIETFDTLYNFLPQQLSSFSISERIIGLYRDRFVGKLWVLEDKTSGNFWLWGPYVKLLYRARGIGSGLVKVALEIIKKNHSLPIYTLTPYQKSLHKFYEKLGFVREGHNDGSSFLVLRRT